MIVHTYTFINYKWNTDSLNYLNYGGNDATNIIPFLINYMTFLASFK